MTETKDKVTIGLRLVSMFIDHFVMTILMVIIVLPGFVVSFFDAFNLDHEPYSSGIGILFFLFILGFAVYFNKDIFNGRSPAKRMLKMQVIDIKTGQAASPLKCLIRNLTIPIWPIEIIFVLINPKRRLGDFIAATRIDYVDNPEKTKINLTKFITTFLIAIGFSFLISSPFLLFKPNPINYIEQTYDPNKSEQINELFETQLEGLIKEADFKFYEQIENDNRKYVSGILYFSNRSDYDNFEESEQKIYNLLTSEFPLESHVCFLKFVYKESGSMSTRQKIYDSTNE